MTAPIITLDEYCVHAGVTKVDLIKIDTDGHELAVLRGAQRTLGRYRPRVIFEIGQYLLAERGQSFRDFEMLFRQHGYHVQTLAGEPVSDANWRRIAPRWGTTDLVAVPQ